jgi:hypothetical protein
MRSKHLSYRQQARVPSRSPGRQRVSRLTVLSALFLVAMVMLVPAGSTGVQRADAATIDNRGLRDFTSGDDFAAPAASARVQTAPANDDFANAKVLTPDAGSLVGETNVDATVEVGEPAHAGYGPARSVWYSFTPTVSGNAVVEADAQDIDYLVLGVYSGSSVAALTGLGSAGPTFGRLRVEFRVVAGVTYHIAVAGEDDYETGLFDLDWSVPSPGNDDFANATVLTPNAGSLVDESNEWASVEVGEPAHANYGPFRSVWYSFTPSVTGNAVVEADAQDIDDLVLGVYSGSSVDTLTELGSVGPSFGPLRVEYRVLAGVTYYIAVAGQTNSDTGLFDLDWRMGPDNDDLITATPLVGDEGALVGESNEWASVEAGEPAHATYGPFRSVWYSFTPSVLGNAVVEADAQDIDDLVLGVYSGSSVDALTELGSAGPSFGRLRVEYRVLAGVTYYIAVAGQTDSDTGLFDLDWRMGPDNDDLVRAKPLVGDAGSLVDESNEWASVEVGEPAHATYGPARSVWYSFTPSHGGVSGVRVDVSDVDDLVLGVYSGSSVDALTELASDGPQFVTLRAEFEIITGTTYYIAVAGQTDYDAGSFDISWGAVDVLVLHPTEELAPADGSAGDHAGYSVALSGDTALVGAPDSDFSSPDAGVVHPFYGTGWSEGAALEAGAPAADDDFGEAVAISGNTAIVGARYSDLYGTNSGAASIFSRSGSTWTEHTALTSVELDGYDYFGGSVAISGDTAVVGATRGGVGGMAFPYVESGGTWLGLDPFSGNDGFNDPQVDSGDYFGVSVAIDGDTLVVGASGDEVGVINSGSITWYLQAGRVYVYVRNGGSWSRQQILVASDFGTNGYFGRSVAVSGDTILVGSNHEAAYLFTRTENTWSQVKRLTPALFSAGFGRIVALDGDTALVGYEDGPFVETHTCNPTCNLRAVLARPGRQYQYAYGDSLAIDGLVALVGSPGAYAEAGAAYLFDLDIQLPNRPPVLATIGDQSLGEGATLDVGITATDSDGDSLSFSITAEPPFATLVDHGDGSATLSLAPGFDDAGEYPGVTVTVSDSVDSDFEMFTITVTDVEPVYIYLPLVVRNH